MLRGFIIVLATLFFDGCTQLDPTMTMTVAPIPTPTLTATEALRSEMCDAVRSEIVPVDDLRNWIASDARVSL